MLPFRKKPAETPPRRRFSEGTSEQAGNRGSGTDTFRLGRTLTGSLSSHVASASEPLAALQSPRTHAHHLSRQRRKVGSVLMGVLVVCGVFAGLLYEFTARETVIAADGSVSLQQARYVKALDTYFAQHPIERLRFMLDKTQLETYVQQALPEVVSIHPEGSAGFGASRFDVTLRKPVASWLIGSAQYFVDASGVPFQVNYYDTPSVRIVDQSGVQEATGTAIASSRFLNFVGRAVSETRAYGLTIEQAVIPSGTTRQVELHITGHDYPVKLSLDRPVGEQIEDMQRAMTYLDSKSTHPSYLDVRVSGRAFYK